MGLRATKLNIVVGIVNSLSLAVYMARELWIGRYTNYPDKQAGVLARDFLQESQILIFAACSHFQLVRV